MPAAAPVASQPSPAVAVPAAEPASAAAPAPAPVASAPSRSASAAAPVPAPAPVDEPGFLAALMENPLAVPAGALLLALLAGLAYYRWRKQRLAESGETSFLESRLQPDSFFGATGGQRIDTREASVASSSSMNYSLSQLDAIGDVDPVAEADVYLAYGRDLQAEEILKEAMRADPSRLAVRGKLLEVYAKRRDTKGFELLATQLYGMTRGEGEDWQKAQALGLQIDAENPLYQPGGKPPAASVAEGMAEPLGASTLPQSVMPSAGFATTSPALEPSAYPEPTPSGFSTIELDLDLDQPTAPGELTPLSMEATRPIGLTQPAAHDDHSLEFDLPLDAPASEYAPPPTTQSMAATAPMDLDLQAMSLDLDFQPTSTTAPPPPPSLDLPTESLSFDLGDLGGVDTAAADLRDDDGDDPLLRKFELADEFRQIGDTEGARDLLEEVVAKATGSLKARAQSLLDSLG